MTKKIVNQNIIAKAVLKLLFNKTELKSRSNKLKKPNYTGRNKRQLCNLTHRKTLSHLFRMHLCQPYQVRGLKR